MAPKLNYSKRNTS